MRTLALGLAFVFGAGALAAEPRIAGEAKYPAYALVRLKAEGVGPTDSLLWKVRPLEDKNEGKVAVTRAGLSGPEIELVAPPGRYRAELFVVRADGPTKLAGAEHVFAIGDQPGPAPKPKPKPDDKKVEPAPKPKPKPDPKPPEPEADPALVKVFAAALAPADKPHAEKLARVYSTTAGLLETLPAATRPKTFADVLAALTEASVSAGVPRLPALAKLRKAVSDELGEFDAMAPVTDALAKELAAKYKRVGAALLAASK